MKQLLAILFALPLLPTYAASQTVTLEVAGMTCAACPITVKKALSNVPCVTRTVVDFDKRSATVTYDDTKVSVATLTKATEAADYPATPASYK